MGAIVMTAITSITYSIVRQDLIVLVFPSIFCVPGSVIGSYAAINILSLNQSKMDQGESLNEKGKL